MALIIEEALEAVLAPARRADLLDEALALAALDRIPEEPSSLRVFVEGALFSALARHLQVADALELVAQIRAALELAMASTEDDRPTSAVRERITMPAPPSRALVVTNASVVVFLLADVLGDGVEVTPVGSLSDLQDRLRRARGTSVLVVIDRRHPCVDLSVCALLREELDAQSTIVWWGASAAEQEFVANLLASDARAVTCGPDVRLPDLGELCRQLLS